MYRVKEFKEIKTRRYVYHLTYEVCRESILEDGLLGGEGYKGLVDPVFAHNRPIPNKIWYPYIMDSWDWLFKDEYGLMVDSYYDYLKYQSLSKGYDVWEIDTHKIKDMKWYIDPWATKDFLDGMNYPYYVVTEGWIPPSVLKLYAFHEEQYFEMGDGVAHIGPDFRPVDDRIIEIYKKIGA